MVSLMALLSYSQPMRFNYCLGPSSIRSTYQSTPPPWHSHYAATHFFSGEPSSNNRNFFFIPRSHLNKGYPQSCIFRRPTTYKANLPVNPTIMALTLCHNSFFLDSPLLKIGTFYFHSKIPFEQRIPTELHF